MTRRARSAIRFALLPLLVSALVIPLAGCASTGVTAGRLNESVAPTFERLYSWKRTLEGEPAAKDLHTRAACHRTTAKNPYQGAGSDWVCTIRFLVDGPNTQVSFNWNVQAKPDGCWNADGVPVQLGQQTVLTSTGNRVINPIYKVDGCFPTS
ncbi:MAG TPA: hypothetical protein VGH14_18830 [Solirubrobacterales bacterium]|jgi:hypothetical protein